MNPIVSVVDPWNWINVELICPDPDPTFQVDPDPNRDPTLNHEPTK